MTLASIFPTFTEMTHRLRWRLLAAWSVICFRRKLIVAVTLGFILFVAVCSWLFPIYSATCVISIEAEVYDY